MANINEILARAAALRDETALNSISPERAGGIMYDTLIALNELWLQQGAALVISKIYGTVAAMEADTSPVSDLTGQPLRPGQIVVIASSDSDNGVIYRYNGSSSPSWTAVGQMGNAEPINNLDSDSIVQPLSAHQGKVLDEKISEIGTSVENPEYIRVYTDAEGRILWGIKPDGSIEWSKGVPQPVREYVVSEIMSNKQFTDEQVASLVELLSRYYEISDREGRLQIVFDAEGKIVAYRSPDGRIVECVGVKTPVVITDTLKTEALDLTAASVQKLLKDLRSFGLYRGCGEWSDAGQLSLSTPRCAVINFSNGTPNMPASWPTSKTADYHYWMEFWDLQGNYFKKRVIFNAQGTSSLGMPKKNGAIDICNDDWEGDDTFKLKIGDWIPQDSFHLKAYYADYFIGVAVVGYELFNRMTKTRDIYSRRDWIKYLVPDKSTIGLDPQATSGLSDNLALDNDARCFPDGFPCLVYLDDIFYGVYSFQLKKHRDNYQMNKSNADEIHLDGMIYYDSIFEANGVLPWDVINGTTTAPSGGNEGFEVRNPKSLICVDGTKYDADTNRKELISSSSPGYDPNNANMVRTAHVRAAMELLSTYIPTLQAMEDGGATVAQIREQIAAFFDVEAIIDYTIFGDIVANYDGYRKNWQWVTWDGVKWMPEPYDLDGILGWSGWDTIAPEIVSHYGNSKRIPTGWVQAYFQSELVSRYKELRDSGVLSKDILIDLLQAWIARIGTDNYSADHRKWPYDTEHYPDAGTVDPHVDSVFRVSNWLEQRFASCDTLYNY